MGQGGGDLRRRHTWEEYPTHFRTELRNADGTMLRFWRKLTAEGVVAPIHIVQPGKEGGEDKVPEASFGRNAATPGPVVSNDLRCVPDILKLESTSHAVYARFPAPETSCPQLLAGPANCLFVRESAALPPPVEAVAQETRGHGSEKGG